MTTYGIISDLHLNFRKTPEVLSLVAKINDAECDKLIIAGDIIEDKEYRELFLSYIQKPYFFINGNHDFWGAPIYDDYTRDGEISGGCLWTNFNRNPIVAYDCRRNLNDFKYVRNPTDTGKVEPFHMEEIFNAQVEKIWEDDPNVIVTHFPPSLRSVHDRFQGDYYTPYFVNNLENRMGHLKAKLWVHGHVHDSFDYFMPNGMRVVCNPLGYPKETSNINDYFVKIVEV